MCPKAKVWKLILKDEETVGLFTHEMAARNDDIAKADDIEKKRLLIKETWLKGTKQVCGMTKVHLDTRRLSGGLEMWKSWLPNKRPQTKCHKAWRKSKSSEDKHTLDVTKKVVYAAVVAAQESKLQEFTADLQSESGRRNCFCMIRQMAREGRDVIIMCCIKMISGMLCLMMMV